LLKTKLPTNSTKSSESGNDESLLKIKEEEKLWVVNGYFSNERETKGRSDFMSHKDVQLPSCFNPYSYQKKRKKKS